MKTLNVTKETGVQLSFSHKKGDLSVKVVAVSLKGTTLELECLLGLGVRRGELPTIGKLDKLKIDRFIEPAINAFLKDCDDMNRGRKKLVFKDMHEFLKSDARKSKKTGDYWTQQNGTIAVYQYASA